MDRKFSRKKTYLIAVAIFLLVANLSLGIVLMKESSDAMRTLLESRMLDISNTAASMIDGDDLRDLTAEDKSTPEYRDILKTLTHFQDNIDLEYIYCIKDNGNKNFTFTVDPTVDDPGEFGEPIMYTDALYEASLGHAAVDKEAYSDRWGRFYSAYSPVFDARGDVAGIVAVDFAAEWYDDQVSYQIKTIVVITILSLFFGMMIMLMTASRAGKRFKSLMQELNNLSDGIETLAEELSDGNRLEGSELLHKDVTETSSRDEISVVADKVRSLEEYMRVQIGYVRSKAYRDGLTGLENRTAYLECVVELNKQIEDGIARFSVAMFDINGLKSINDQSGHERGDREIIKASEILRDAFPDERIFRIGGDEFVVIINRFAEEAGVLMDRCRQLINDEKNEEGVGIIMSTGYSEYDAARDRSYQDTFDRADRLMYESKKAFYETKGDRRRSV